MSKDTVAVLFALMAFFLILGYETQSRLKRRKHLSEQKETYEGGRR